MPPVRELPVISTVVSCESSLNRDGSEPVRTFVPELLMRSVRRVVISASSGTSGPFRSLSTNSKINKFPEESQMELTEVPVYQSHKFALVTQFALLRQLGPSVV